MNRKSPRGLAVLLLLLLIPPAGCKEDPRPDADQVLPAPVAGPGRGEAPEAAVQRALDDDEAASKRYVQIRYRDAESWFQGHQAYAREMGAIDLEGTPDRFKDAFLRHQEAWRVYMDYLSTFPVERLRVFVDSDQAARPENRDLVLRARDLNRVISTTWTEVEMVASTRGVGDGPSLREPPPPVGSTRRLIHKAPAKAAE